MFPAVFYRRSTVNNFADFSVRVRSLTSRTKHFASSENRCLPTSAEKLLQTARATQVALVITITCANAKQSDGHASYRIREFCAPAIYLEGVARQQCVMTSTTVTRARMSRGANFVGGFAR